MLTKTLFDTMEDGREVTCFRITNTQGAYVEIINYAGIIRAICVPDRAGNLTDVTLGFDSVKGYQTYSGNFGATIGRYANRIRKGHFTLNGESIQLAINNGPNHLHGGPKGFHKQLWDVAITDDNSVTLKYFSPDGEENYPGNLTTFVRYTFDDTNTLTIEYKATSDKDTLYNPTNHAYFNLHGHGEGNLGAHQVRINAKAFSPVDSDCMGLDTLEPFRGAMDINKLSCLGDGLSQDATDPDLIAGGGYDHNFVLADRVQSACNLAATVYSPISGIRMRTYTTMPGVQFYTGNFMADGMAGKNNATYNRRGGLCLETQFFPDSPNQPAWPSPILRADDMAVYTTKYTFDLPKEIVILDGYTTNPGDLSWAPLEEIGHVTVYDRTPASEILNRAKETEIVITNKTVLTEEIIGNLPKLRYVGLLSTGTNAVDLKACKARGIAVTNVPGYSTEDVAQLTFGLMLELALHVGHHSNRVRNGAWTSSKDFCFWETPLIELAGKTLGIVGYGAIGSRVCEIARAFRMNVLVYTRTPKALPEGVKAVSLDELLAQADVVSLHCPLTADNAQLINQETLSKMKPGAFLINTARGGLLDEAAVAQALNEGYLAGCGVDVLSTEPPKADNPLLTAKNCIITPHIAWAATEARSRLIGIVAENVQAFLRGTRHNRVE